MKAPVNVKAEDFQNSGVCHMAVLIISIVLFYPIKVLLMNDQEKILCGIITVCGSIVSFLLLFTFSPVDVWQATALSSLAGYFLGGINCLCKMFWGAFCIPTLPNRPC